jgi:hypothetical protein
MEWNPECGMKLCSTMPEKPDIGHFLAVKKTI